MILMNLCFIRQTSVINLTYWFCTFTLIDLHWESQTIVTFETLEREKTWRYYLKKGKTQIQ